MIGWYIIYNALIKQPASIMIKMRCDTTEMYMVRDVRCKMIIV